MTPELVDIISVKANPDNPRIIKDERFECQSCGEKFNSIKASKNRTPKYCSRKCYAISLIKLKTCPVCSKQYNSDPNTKYCSVGCYKIGRPTRKGVALSTQWKEALSEGRKNSSKCKGKNLYNWKGGKETLSERMKLHSIKRKSLQKIELDQSFLDRLFKVQKGRCFYCDSELINYKAIEHLTPLSRGGDNQKYNLVYCCRSCNSKKRSQTLEEFAIRTDRLSLIDKYDLVFPEALYGI